MIHNGQLYWFGWLYGEGGFRNIQRNQYDGRLSDGHDVLFQRAGRSYAYGEYVSVLSCAYVAQACQRYSVQLNRMIPFSSPWFRTVYVQTIDFQDNVAELGKTRRRIYDYGKNFVLDLLQPSAGSERPSNGWGQ
jgi:hypothetical protein